MQKLYMNLRGNSISAPIYNNRYVAQHINIHPCRQSMFNIMHGKKGGCSSCRG